MFTYSEAKTNLIQSEDNCLNYFYYSNSNYELYVIKTSSTITFPTNIHFYGKVSSDKITLYDQSYNCVNTNQNSDYNIYNHFPDKYIEGGYEIFYKAKSVKFFGKYNFYLYKIIGKAENIYIDELIQKQELSYYINDSNNISRIKKLIINKGNIKLQLNGILDNEFIFPKNFTLGSTRSFIGLPMRISNWIMMLNNLADETTSSTVISISDLTEKQLKEQYVKYNETKEVYEMCESSEEGAITVLEGLQNKNYTFTVY